MTLQNVLLLVFVLSMTRRIDVCSYQMGGMDFKILTHFSPIIFPGTKWCGKGNIAQYKDDLGEFEQTDTCCRQHDYCDDVIRGDKSKHGLKNDVGYTRLNCECDNKFLECLMASNETVSRVVGTTYFTLLRTKCFAFTYPATCSSKYNLFWFWLRGRCETYTYNKSLPPVWQWFDLQEFPWT